MKTRAFYKTMTLLVTLTMFLSCVDDDDFGIPETSTIDPIAALNLTSEQLKSVPEVKALFGGGDNVELVSDIYLDGYVVSSDAGGNFFEELYVQDDPTNPTAGIRIALDQRDLYLTYDVGRRIVMKLQGYYIGLGDGDVISIGQQIGVDIEGISELEIPSIMTRSNDVAAIEGLPLSFGEINASHIGMFVSVDDVQINRSLLGEPFVDPNDPFDTQRTLEGCADGSAFVMETSSFADFKQVSLPQGSGTISGIITQDFFGDIILMALNEAADFSAEGERCDPAEFIIGDPLNCGGTSTGGPVVIYAEDFESFSDSGDLIAAGWTLSDIDGSAYNWGISGFGGNTYAIGNAFNTDIPSINAWMITPPLDLNNSTDEVLNFDVQTNFNGGLVLEVYISTDFVDFETDSNWSLLEQVDIPDGPSGGFGSFQPAGPVDLSCVVGDNVRIAFRYFGGDPGITTRYHVDDVEVTGN